MKLSALGRLKIGALTLFRENISERPAEHRIVGTKRLTCCASRPGDDIVLVDR